MVTIQIKTKTLDSLKKAAKEIASQALKAAIRRSLEQTQKSVTSFARAQLNKQKEIKVPVKLFHKRVFRQLKAKDNTPIKDMKASIGFSTFQEAVSNFLLRTEKILGKKGKRKYTKVTAKILGKDVSTERTFLRLSKKGNAIKNTKIALGRESSARDSYKREMSNVSMTDVIKNNMGIADLISAKAKQTYLNRLKHNINYYLDKELKKVK